MRRLVCSAACAGSLVLLAACSSCKSGASGSGGGDAGTAQAPAGLTEAQAKQVLAHVGDRTITLGDFAAAIEHMDQFDRMRYQAPERRKELLNEMIDVMLLADEARAHGYDKDPATEQELREILRDAYVKKVRQGVPQPKDIPDTEVKAYFDAHKADFHDPERRRVSIIALPSRGAAEAVLASAHGASPSQWGELVRSRSIDPTAKANVPVDLAGDVGFVSPPGDPRGANTRVPDEVRAAAFESPTVAAGDVVSHVVAVSSLAGGTMGRFYVVRITSKTDPHDRTLQDVENTIRVKLAQQKAHEKEEASIDALRQQFQVKIDETALGQVRVALPEGGVDAGAAPR
ncbi:MAG TPA: peptidylprolyl isomerase [Polyangiaceae bacterium]